MADMRRGLRTEGQEDGLRTSLIEAIFTLIVAELESGRTDLEQSIEAYERGSKLKAYCEAKLKEAQLRVEKIVIGPSGQPRVEPAEF